MAGGAVTTERDGHVGIVRIDRPETRNALTADVKAMLAEACRLYDDDREVRCIVIAGTDDYFAAGADMEATSADPNEGALSFWPAMAAIQTPLIAAVSGYALGAGCELALLCDMVVAAETADFGQPEIMLGIIPGGGATQRLTRVIGKQRAMELVLTGRRISGHEAYRLGLVNQATRKKEWFVKAVEIAHVVARRPPVAARLGKQAVLAADELGLTGGLERERELRDAAMATEDRVEGMTAFLEKRPPDFKGR
jgi:enoyl-CoA hydratase/carnithine racemase